MFFFQSFSKAVVVSNFPLKERTDDEMQEIDYITRLRKIEIADQKASKQDKKEVSNTYHHLLKTWHNFCRICQKKFFNDSNYNVF